MAACSESAPILDINAIIAYNAPEAPGTRHIRMYSDDTHQKTIIKFLNVPDEYGLADIKHADLAGMFYTFRNGDTWLTLNDKRLFLTPDYGEDAEEDRAPESPEDWPMMSPDELKQALSVLESYEDMHAMYMAAQERHKAAITKLEDHPLQEHATCSTARFHHSSDC